MTPTFYPDRPGIDPVTKRITCRNAMTGALWLDEPGRLAITYHGGRVPRTVTLNGRGWTIGAGVDTTIRTSAPTGYSRFTAAHDWHTNAGTPTVRAAT